MSFIFSGTPCRLLYYHIRYLISFYKLYDIYTIICFTNVQCIMSRRRHTMQTILYMRLSLKICNLLLFPVRPWPRNRFQLTMATPFYLCVSKRNVII